MSTPYEPTAGAPRHTVEGVVTPGSGAHTPAPTQAEARAESESIGALSFTGEDAEPVPFEAP